MKKVFEVFEEIRYNAIHKDYERIGAMEDFGFVREQLDIKILILYILARLPGPVDRESLSDVVFCDGAINYFTFSECLSELISTGHIVKEYGKYEITARGREDGAMIETSLPISVRDNADVAMLPVADKISRESLIRTEHTANVNGCTVHLTLSDGKGKIFDLSALVADEEQAKIIEKKFRNSAEDLYVRILNLFME